MSKMDATLFGSTSKLSPISLAIGPDNTIATVLFAVHKSTKNANIAIPNSAPLLPFVAVFMPLTINSIPPFYFTNATIHATIIDIMEISNSQLIPFQIALIPLKNVKLFVAIPTIIDNPMPENKTAKTLNPINAPIKTTK